jgi:hypothetical protein
MHLLVRLAETPTLEHVQAQTYRTAALGGRDCDVGRETSWMGAADVGGPRRFKPKTPPGATTYACAGRDYC